EEGRDAHVASRQRAERVSAPYGSLGAADVAAEHHPRLVAAQEELGVLVAPAPRGDKTDGTNGTLERDDAASEVDDVAGHEDAPLAVDVQHETRGATHLVTLPYDAGERHGGPARQEPAAEVGACRSGRGILGDRGALRKEEARLGLASRCLGEHVGETALLAHATVTREQQRDRPTANDGIGRAEGNHQLI